MATTEHATNAQMAAIMGWTFTYGEWLTADGNPTGYTNIPGRYDYFDPRHNLNHTALVEARLAELGLQIQYGNALWDYIKGPFPSRVSELFPWITAPTQTRCDAAWATWQAWKEQAK
jgi:hypothetical protein